MRYLTNEQLTTNLSLGKSVEQWLSFETKDDYVVLKWLRIDKEKDSTYSVSYIECFDDGDTDYIDIYSFSPVDPDERECKEFRIQNPAFDVLHRVFLVRL